MEAYGKKSQENGPKADKDKTELATGLGRRTRDEIIKKSGMKLKALRFQKGGRTSEIHGFRSEAVTAEVPGIWNKDSTCLVYRRP